MVKVFEKSVGILNVTHQGAACNVAGVHFGATIRRTDTCCLHDFYVALAQYTGDDLTDITVIFIPLIANIFLHTGVQHFVLE